jgi:hypothetical protein
MFATAGGDMKMRLWKYSTPEERKDDFHDFLDMDIANLDQYLKSQPAERVHGRKEV